MINTDNIEQHRQSGQTFCPYLFLHYHLDTDKATKVCCHATSSINDRTIDFNSGVYNSLRKKVLNNEKLTSCNRCYEAEDNGFTSLRQRAFDDVFTQHRGQILTDQVNEFVAGNKIMPLWYDLRISNNCNLSCIMCGPKYSSTWAKKKGEEDVHLLYESDVKISPNAYKIQLAGGEPFMIKKFAKMLSEIENTDCEIVVNTNATIVTKPLFEQLKRFKNVWIVVSVDGYGELNDRIREGSNWNTVVKNMKMFMDNGLNVLVNTVLQRDNVNHLYELGHFLESMGIDDWIISPLFFPNELKWETQENINYAGLEKASQLNSVQRNENSLTLLQHILKEKP